MPLNRLNTGQCTVHGTLVTVAGVGVLLTGAAGTGKSACALDLLAGGHGLVADDVVQVERVHEELVGSAPERFCGLLEIRGLGICDVRQLFAVDSAIPRHTIDLSIEFSTMERAPGSRLPESRDTLPLLGVSIPQVLFLADGTRSARVFVEAAVRFFSNKDCDAAPRLIAEHDLLTRSAADDG